MTKKELIERVAEDAGLTKKAAEIALNSVLSGIQNSYITNKKAETIVSDDFYSVREA